MPLTAEQVSALEALFAPDGPLHGADPEDVAEGLRSKVTPVFTVILNEGHQKGGGQSAKEIKKLQKRLEEAEARNQQLSEQLTNGNPDIEKVRKDAQTEVASLRQQIKDMEEQHERDEDQRVRDEAVALYGSLLESKEVGSVRPSWARNLKGDPETHKRIRVVKDGEGKRSVVVMQAGKEIPIAADDDTREAQLRALALETRKRLEKEDPDAIRVPVDSGGGVHGDVAGGEGGDGYDPAKEGKEMAKRQANQQERNKDLAFR